MEVLLEHGWGGLYRGPIYGGGDIVGGPGGPPGGVPLDRPPMAPHIGGLYREPIYGEPILEEGPLEEGFLEEYIRGQPIL